MEDRRILQELSRHEALRLLAGVAVGRVVFTQRALPAIRPVNHILDHDDVIIRTSLASSVADTVIRRPETVVAYEADLIDPDTRKGWSVVVTGIARLVDNPQDRTRYEAMLRPWAQNPTDGVLRIRADIVTGFRLTSPT